MQIFFCEQCSKRLSDVDIEKGSAVVVDDLVYCRACAQSSGIHAAAKPESSRDKPKTGRHITTARLHVPGTGQIQPKSTARQFLLPLTIVGVAVLVLVGFVMSMSRKRGGEAANPPLPPVREQPRVEQPATQSPVVPAPSATWMPKESPKPPVAEPLRPPPVEPPKSVPTNTSEEVLFSSDFEKDAVGWHTTERIEDATLPGSRWSGKALESSTFFSRRAVFVCWEIRPKIDYLFIGAESAYIGFDYFVSGGTEPARIGITVFDQTTNQNWDARDVNVEKGKWGTLRYSVATDFRPDTGKPPQMPADCAITEVKICMRPPGQDFTLLIDNLRITRTKTASVVPPAIQETPAGKETVVFSSNLETGANGWTFGSRISDNVPPGSKWAFRASTEPESKDSFSRAIELQSVEMRPSQQKLFIFSSNQYLVIDYFLSSATGEYPLYIMCFDSVLKKNLRYGLSSPLQGKWTSIRLALREFKTLEGVRMSPGDSVRTVIIGAGQPGEQTELIVSGLRVVEE